ncbi:MAG TPA: c-type cytochrome [Caldimonas sp.]|nr:c-type cytochrome [Caldimonas sp.]HEX4233823.1 c-type cytochrome [Caldimonas sp.]
MSSCFPERALFVVLLGAAILTGCERETRTFDPPVPAAAVGTMEGAAEMVGRYERNAYALAAGKRLWTWYNCNGCHANGGGSSGPALIDDVWIYGGDAGSIYKTIADGRPNGMPAFGDRMANEQLWQLAAYVRSMAGLAPQDAAPNRDDAFLTRTPESFMDAQKPETATPSAGSGRPQ